MEEAQVAMVGERMATDGETPSRTSRLEQAILRPCRRLHSRLPYIQHLPLPALLIVIFLIFVNLMVWLVISILLSARYPHLLSTAALAYSLGLRHALDADHISAIDLMTRRLIATGQRPVAVGTFFSLGHSTIVVITSIVVAATAAEVSEKFSGFSHVGGIIGSSVSAVFLILLGFMNGYILYRLVVQMRKVIRLSAADEEEGKKAWEVEGGGVLFRVLKKMFKLIDRPWKMYPLGVMFGLGFDTSSEVALLGISSIQGAKGTSMWLILVFPVLFTAGMCLLDTVDGALMSSLYLAPLGLAGADKNEEESQGVTETRVKSPLTFLYYSIVLTALTVVVALVIGTIQLLTMVVNVAVSDEDAEENRFWRGVNTAGNYYDAIGGGICASFVVVGIASVLCFKPWRRWVDRERQRLGIRGFRNGCEMNTTRSKLGMTDTSNITDRSITMMDIALPSYVQSVDTTRASKEKRPAADVIEVASSSNA